MNISFRLRNLSKINYVKIVLDKLCINILKDIEWQKKSMCISYVICKNLLYESLARSLC